MDEKWDFELRFRVEEFYFMSLYVFALTLELVFMLWKTFQVIYVTMSHKKLKEPDFIDIEPINIVLPKYITVAQFLGRWMVWKREAKQHKVDTVVLFGEKQVDNPIEEVMCKKVGKK